MYSMDFCSYSRNIVYFFTVLIRCTEFLLTHQIFVYQNEPVVCVCVRVEAGCSVRSALCQTTCLIMPSRVLQLSRPPLHLDLLQRLLSSGRHVVDGRNCSLDPTQITHLSVLLIPSTGKALKVILNLLNAKVTFITSTFLIINSLSSYQESLLPEGPRLVLALQTDNIVTCFDSILKRQQRIIILYF